MIGELNMIPTQQIERILSEITAITALFVAGYVVLMVM